MLHGRKESAPSASVSRKHWETLHKQQKVETNIISKLCIILFYRFTLKHDDYDPLDPPARYGAAMARNASTCQCQCSVCQVGCPYVVNYITFREKVSESVGWPRIHPPTEAEPIQLCNISLCSWSRGQEHNCNKESKIQNLQKKKNGEK